MQDKSDLLLFIGRFHPLIVHLPIGLLSLQPVLELAAWKFKKPGLDTACRINLGLCAASAVGAVLIGLCLASNGSYGGDSFALHKKLGIALAAVLCLAACLRSLSREDRKPLAAWGLTALGLGLLTPVGHMGGNLTHGPTWLTEYSPAWLPMPGKEAPKADAAANAWLDTVKPILQKNCTECHSGKEAKGDCNLEDPKLLLAGGKSGKPGIVPGQPEQSEVMRRILLPAGHPDGMPTEGKKSLSGDEVLALSHWITSGALFDAAKAGEEIAPAPAALQGLVAAGAYLRPCSEGSPLLCADFTRPGCKLAEALAALPSAAPRIAELKLARSALSDADLEALPVLPELSVLDLAGTAISAKGLAALSRQPKLRTLNLAGTATDDSAALGLAGIKSLRRVNLANAKLSKDGANELRRARFGDEAITVICPAPVIKLSDKSSWTIVKVSSQETSYNLGAYPARQAIDGKPETLWTTRYAGGHNDPPPHELILDLGDSTIFQGLKLLARQDGNPNGISAKIEVFVSDDPKVFKDAIIVAEPWKGAPDAKAWLPLRDVRFPQIATGRYLRLVFSADIRGNPWATLAELDLIQE